ncbi:MAG: aminopeptidase P family protein [Chloroflexi bacterium]|nr:aminopeptidase P family protein [Chloroflexota bacterium]
MSEGWDHAGRLGRAQAGLRDRGADGLVIGLGADLRYLTGHRAPALERLTALVLPARGAATLLAPRLEAMAAAGCPAARDGVLEVVAWDETDDPYRLVAHRLAASLGGSAPWLLVNADLPARHLLELQRALPVASFALGDEVLGELRVVKEPAEVERLRRAAAAADRTIASIAAGRLVGRTEADVSHEVRERLVAEGHDEASFAIVGSGPNSASPHHEPGDRVIGPGEPVVLDIGGTLDGYGSDITRTFWVTGPDGSIGPDPQFVELFELVRRAQAAATAAVRPGITCEALDAVARRVIGEAGRADEFLHRLGHGIGLEAHEAPYLVAGNDTPLRPGMAFRIEPGIYVAGRWGARIEDIVVCGEDGPIVLNEAGRDLYVVPG